MLGLRRQFRAKRTGVVNALDTSLTAGNTVEHRLTEPFDPAFEQLRSDYNGSLGGLHATMSGLPPAPMASGRPKPTPDRSRVS